MANEAKKVTRLDFLQARVCLLLWLAVRKRACGLCAFVCTCHVERCQEPARRPQVHTADEQLFFLTDSLDEMKALAAVVEVCLPTATTTPFPSPPL